MEGTAAYLSKITLNVNGLNSPIKRDWLGYKNKTQLFLPIRNAPHWQRQTQA
jgi:hypothetical protein